MGLFGLSLISTEELKILQRSYGIEQRAAQAHRWFSGWKDLDIIWDYIFGQNYKMVFGVEEARKEYAKARNTNVYGKANGSP